ncbi:MAG: low molecular weight phosphotyrosine protein phosphatase [Steroidobacteraceae bacterium]|nr:low molecular weight phosphotyrosine protein phosphatase [Steroidobacteraceae bacterium]
MRVLCVCLGNICRSPTAEGVLRDLAAREAPGLRIEVDSAGTAGYHIGAAPDPRSRRAALARGIDIGALRARQVVPEDFRRFDFLLAMDAANLRDLRAVAPAGASAQLRLLMDYAPQSGRLEVPDPYYGDERDFELVLDLVQTAARGFLASLPAAGR